MISFYLKYTKYEDTLTELWKYFSKLVTIPVIYNYSQLLRSTYELRWGEINTYWADIKRIDDNIPSKLIKMRRTDNNGQVAANETNSNIIGNCDLGNKTDS